MAFTRMIQKLGVGEDLRGSGYTKAAISALPDAHLTVDANSHYTLADMDMIVALDGFELDHIEQPLASKDIRDHALLQARMKTALCLDQYIRPRKALASRATRVINIKVRGMGGYGEARRTNDLGAACSFPVWCGGMLESGASWAHNFHLSTRANFRIATPHRPGIGVTLDRAFLDKVTVSTERFGA